MKMRERYIYKDGDKRATYAVGVHITRGGRGGIQWYVVREVLYLPIQNKTRLTIERIRRK